VRPYVMELEHNDTYPAEIVEKMKELGLFGSVIEEEYGGLGLSVSRQTGNGVPPRQQARGPQLLGAAPIIEVFKRPGRQPLAFGDTLWLEVTLDQGSGDAALAEFHSQADANRAAADNDNLITLCHHPSLSHAACIATSPPRHLGIAMPTGGQDQFCIRF
jgi:hypothetical protein